MTILNPEAIGDPDRTPILHVTGPLAEMVRTNGRIHAFRQALGGDCPHDLMPNFLAAIATSPDTARRVADLLEQFSRDREGLSRRVRASYDQERNDYEGHNGAIRSVLRKSADTTSDTELGAIARALLAIEDDGS